MAWLRRAAICMTVAAGLLCPGMVSAQEMPSEYKTVLTTLGKGGDFKDGVLKVNTLEGYTHGDRAPGEKAF